MTLHCDKCNRPLGDYLYGKGGIVERAKITHTSPNSLPDIVCFECVPKGGITLDDIKKVLYEDKENL